MIRKNLTFQVIVFLFLAWITITLFEFISSFILGNGDILNLFAIQSNFLLPIKDHPFLYLYPFLVYPYKTFLTNEPSSDVKTWMRYEYDHNYDEDKFYRAPLKIFK